MTLNTPAKLLSCWRRTGGSALLPQTEQKEAKGLCSLSPGVWCRGCPCPWLPWQMEVDVCCLLDHVLAQLQPPCPADGLGSGLGAGQMLEEPRCQERHKAGNSLTCTCV